MKTAACFREIFPETGHRFARLAGAAILLAFPAPASRAADAPPPGETAALDRLVKAYPDFLAGHDGASLLWKDGARTPIPDGGARSFEERLKSPTLLDQLAIPYPKGPLTKPPGPWEDPGRFRNAAFFDRMYGDCERNGLRGTLVRIPWLPRSGGGFVEVTTVNGVADRLRAVSDDLEHLPPDIRRYAWPSAGAYNCRVVQDTGNRSPHAWGIAIDINTKFADYWLWSKGGPYRNRVPYEIVAVFEKHGFIWGGKWGHFDTMHFEYRPELF